MSIGDVANALQIHVSLESFLLGQEPHLLHSNLWFLYYYFYLSIWPHCILAEACWIIRCGIRDLIPPLGIELGSSVLETWYPSRWTTRETPGSFFRITSSRTWSSAYNSRSPGGTFSELMVHCSSLLGWAVWPSQRGLLWSASSVSVRCWRNKSP